MSALEQLPIEVLVSGEMLADTISRIRSGEPFVGLLIDSVTARAAALEAVLDQVLDGEFRVAWVGNPLRSPLTLERFFLQAVGPRADLRVERRPAELAAMLAKPLGAEKRLLVILQQPETMDAEMRETLGAMPPYWRELGAHIQILFSGTSSFQLPQIAQLPPRASLPLALTAPTAPARRHRHILPIVVLAALTAIGVFVAAPWTSDVTSSEPLQALPSSTPAQIPGVSEAATLAKPPAAQSPAPAPAEAAASPPPVDASTATAVEDVVALRREFDAFLTQRAPALAAMSEPQKDALFQEFLERHRAQRADTIH